MCWFLSQASLARPKTTPTPWTGESPKQTPAQLGLTGLLRGGGAIAAVLKATGRDPSETLGVQGAKVYYKIYKQVAMQYA